MKTLVDALRTEQLVPGDGHRLQPLFAAAKEYERFSYRYQSASVVKGDLQSYCGPCYLGVDAGSTTCKIALIVSDGQLLFSFYAPNRAKPIETVLEGLSLLQKRMPVGARMYAPARLVTERR